MDVVSIEIHWKRIHRDERFKHNHRNLRVIGKGKGGWLSGRQIAEYSADGCRLLTYDVLASYAQHKDQLQFNFNSIQFTNFQSAAHSTI